MIKEGMIVRFDPNWCEPSERDDIMVVLEAYPDVKRCQVRCVNCSLAIPPIETVSFEMVVPDAYYGVQGACLIVEPEWDSEPAVIEYNGKQYWEAQVQDRLFEDFLKSDDTDILRFTKNHLTEYLTEEFAV